MKVITFDIIIFQSTLIRIEMSDNIRDQTLPWVKLQIIISVLEQQHNNIKMFVNLKEQNMLTLNDIEKRMVGPFMIIFDAIKKAF